MAIRIREVKGTLVALCAARTEAEKGDTYLDDGIHYALSMKFWRDKAGEGWMEPGSAKDSPEWVTAEKVENVSLAPIQPDSPLQETPMPNQAQEILEIKRQSPDAVFYYRHYNDRWYRCQFAYGHERERGSPKTDKQWSEVRQAETLFLLSHIRLSPYTLKV